MPILTEDDHRRIDRCSELAAQIQTEVQQLNELLGEARKLNLSVAIERLDVSQIGGPPCELLSADIRLPLTVKGRLDVYTAGSTRPISIK